MQLPRVTLNNGYQIPALGFGTYKSTLNSSQPLTLAIEVGYRFFDTAAFYQNEKELGQAIRNSGFSREEFTISSKVWKTEMGYEQTRKSFRTSLELLEMEYLDLYLIHWPKADLTDPDWDKKVIDTWNALEELYSEGRIRAIGVSNFLPHHIQVILEHCQIHPAVNQFEFHPGYLQEEALAFCQKYNIVVQGWSPIGRGRIFHQTQLKQLAEKYGVSLARLCLRFAVQMGVIPLPKASSIERMKENMDIFTFEISEEDMKQIRSIPQTGWSGEHPDRERVVI